MTFDDETLWLLDNNPIRNPKFSSWTRVYLKYCSSDLWYFVNLVQYIYIYITF